VSRASLTALLALATGSVAAFLWLRPAPPHENLVIVLVDTLRSDHLGAYGYARATSPAIDALADRGTVFTSACSVSNWTNPAIKTIFTGLSPQAVMPEARHDEAITMPLPGDMTTFAQRVRDRGYRTAALVDHPGIKPWGYFDRGFEQYTMLYEEDGLDAWGKTDVDHVAGRFAERLDAYLNDPFLIYVHVIYPHRPYQAPAPYQGLFGPDTYADYDSAQRDSIVNAYDAEIRRTDDLVARLVDALEDRSLLEKTWVLLLSDHGEGFWEHGFDEHGNAFFDEAIRIPLILVPPKGRQDGPEQVDAPVSNLDTFATILDITGVPLPEETMGVSLLERGPSGAGASRVLFSESAHSHDIHAAAVIRDGFKYTVYPSLPEPEHYLFDLHEDPFELANLYGTQPALEMALETLLEDHRAESTSLRRRLAQSVVVPDRETMERLRALGYIR